MEALGLLPDGVTETRLLGQAQPRLEGRSKVTGATRFTADLHPHGLCHARLVLSTVPAGRVSSVEYERRDRPARRARRPDLAGLRRGR